MPKPPDFAAQFKDTGGLIDMLMSDPLAVVILEEADPTWEGIADSCKSAMADHKPEAVVVAVAAIIVHVMASAPSSPKVWRSFKNIVQMLWLEHKGEPLVPEE